MILTGRQVLVRAKKNRKIFKDILVPGLGLDNKGNPVKIRVTVPSLGQMDNLQIKMAKLANPQEGYKANLLIACCINPDGSPMFSDQQFETLNTTFAFNIFMPVIQEIEKLLASTNLELTTKKSKRSRRKGFD